MKKRTDEEFKQYGIDEAKKMHKIRPMCPDLRPFYGQEPRTWAITPQMVREKEGLSKKDEAMPVVRVEEDTTDTETEEPAGWAEWLRSGEPEDRQLRKYTVNTMRNIADFYEAQGATVNRTDNGIEFIQRMGQCPMCQEKFIPDNEAVIYCHKCRKPFPRRGSVWAEKQNNG